MRFDPSKIYLHGGPGNLTRDRLVRYGRHGQDAGALFFTPDTPAGKLYAAAYASVAKDPAIWKVHIKLHTNDVFDFGRMSHRYRLGKLLSPQEQLAIWRSAEDTGQIDWPHVDEETMVDAGFGGAILSERSSFAGCIMSVYSIAVFDSNNVEIVGRVSDAELARTMQKLNSLRIT